MPRNGSGTFTRSNGTNTGATTWALDRDGETKISAQRHDAHDEDFATGITNSLAKNGETSPSANLPMAGYKHTNVDAASARTDYARASQLQDNALAWGGTTGGSANVLTASLSPAITAYAAGLRVQFIAGNSNSGAATLNVNGVGAKDIKKYTSATALVANEILSGGVYECIYDTSAGGRWILLNPSVPVLYGVNLDGLTASRPLSLDASKNIQSPTAASFLDTLTGTNPTAWSPTLGKSGSMTISGAVVREGHYSVRPGVYIDFQVAIDTITVSGSALNDVFTISGLPAGNAHASQCSFICTIVDNGTAKVGLWRYDGTNLVVFLGGVAAFANASGTTAIHIDGRIKRAAAA